jgi:hypothetical protein
MKLGFCCVCGDTEDLHQHHILPVVSSNKKRDTRNDETVTLCNKHHLQIHEKAHTGGYKHRELVVQGLRKAKENGVLLGRPSTLTSEMVKQVWDMAHAGIGVRETCRTLKVGTSTYYKIINRKYNDLLVKQQQNPDILIKVLERFSSPEKNQEIRKPEDSPRK